MSRLSLLAAATLTLALSPLAQAAPAYVDYAQAAPADLRQFQQEVSRMPAWTPANAHDYNGEGSSFDATPNLSSWTPEQAHDYTGNVESAYANDVAQMPAWDTNYARDYTGATPHLCATSGTGAAVASC